MQKPVIQFTVIPENNCYLAGPMPGNQSSRKLYLYLQLNGKRHESQQKRVPLNISMVIDKSGSMNGAKLDNVKTALDFVIGQLRQEDYLSIVEYDTQVSVLQAQQEVKNKEALRKKVKNITSGSMTNLSGGMMEGYAQVLSTQKEGYVNRALLLSDGLANHGVTEPAALQQIAQKKFREAGVALSTFGVGADYNEDLMTNLSEYGGGNYHFIEAADKIPEMFAKELQGLLAVIAQRARAQVKFPSSVKFVQSFGYLSEVQGNEVLINFNDVFSEEEKAVVLEFELTDQAEGDLTFESTLSYEDVIETMASVSQSETTIVRMTSDSETLKAGLNVKALDNVAQFVGNDLLEKAIAAMDKRNSNLAKKLIAEAKAYLDGVFKVLNPSDGLRTLYTLITEYGGRIEDMGSYTQQEMAISQKMSKAGSYNYRKRKS
jgi:Ca-activated chloride channel family protein